MKKCKNVRHCDFTMVAENFYVRHMQVLCKTVLHFGTVNKDL